MQKIFAFFTVKIRKLTRKPSISSVNYNFREHFISMITVIP